MRKLPKVQLSIVQLREIKPEPDEFIHKIYGRMVTESDLNTYLRTIRHNRENLLQRLKNEFGIEFAEIMQMIAKGAYYGKDLTSLLKDTFESITALNKAEADIISAWYKGI